MSGEVMLEQRSAVMVLVDVSWEDQNGTLQTTRARMENRSTSGACVRVARAIEVGAQLRIRSHWEEFTGVAKYCRPDGKEFLVGIQRDLEKSAIPRLADPVPVSTQGAKSVSLRNDAQNGSRSGARNGSRNGAAVAVGTKGGRFARRPRATPREFPAAVRRVKHDVERKVERVTGNSVDGVGAAGVGGNTAAGARGSLQFQDFDVPRWIELQAKQIGETPREAPLEIPNVNVKAREAGDRSERKPMQRKWLDVGSWGDKQEAAHDSSSGNSNNSGKNNSAENNAAEKTKNAPNATNVAPPFATPPFAKDKPRAGAAPDGEMGYQGELLPLEDIYRAAGITNPRGGYSIVKIVEMLHSEHLRNLSKDMRRASMLMALDAAGVPLNEVLRDAKTRLEAIDAYEAEQRKLCEAEWARKEEENLQIRAELERVKAQYLARINRNLEAVAREKARFTSWQTLNQREAQNISAAAELCLKPAAADPPAPAPEPAPAPTSTPTPTTSHAAANVKVV
jgi:hypothetical protein